MPAIRGTGSGSAAVRNLLEKVGNESDRGFWALVTYLGLAGLCYYEAYSSLVTPSVPLMDTLRYLIQLKTRWWKSREGLLTAWSHGQQSGLIDPLFDHLGVRYLSLNVPVICALTGGVLFLLFYFASRMFARWSAWQPDGGRTQARIGGIRILALTSLAVGTFSVNGWELYNLTLGFPETLRTLLQLVAAWITLKAISADTLTGGLVVRNVALNFLIIVVFGMGQVYGYAICLASAGGLSLFANWRQRGQAPKHLARRALLLLAPLVLLSIYITLAVRLDTGAATAIRLSDVPDMLFRWICSLSLVFVTQDVSLADGTMGAFNFGLGLFVLLLSGYACARLMMKCRSDAMLWFVAFLVLYALCVLLSIAVARGADRPELVLSSRYYINAVPLTIGLVIALSRLLGEDLVAASVTRRAGSTLLLLVFCGFLGVLQVMSAMAEWNSGSFRAAYFARTRMMVLCKRPLTWADAAQLQVNSVEVATTAVDIMEKRRLGPFSVPEAKSIYCDRPLEP